MHIHFKKTIAILTALCLLIVFLPSQAFAAAPKNFNLFSNGLKLDKAFSAKTNDIPKLIPRSVTTEGFIYEIVGNKVVITGYKGKEDDITIPDTIGGKQVTSIAAKAFSYNSDYDVSAISKITIGANIGAIGEGAFDGQDIMRFTVDAANTQYASDATGALFNKAMTILIQYCAGSFIDSYAVPEGVTEIKANAFSGASNLEKLTLPQSLKTIGEAAFIGCDRLLAITLPQSVQTIGAYAFAYCSFKTFTIPKNVTKIGDYAFISQALTAVNVDAANTAYSSAGGVLFDKAKKTLILYPMNKAGATYSIPNTVVKLHDASFLYCQYLATLNIPASVTSMTPLKFEENFMSIMQGPAAGSIYGCGALKAINVHAANTKYSSTEGVLFNKSKTQLILYPASKTSKSFTVPGSVKTIGSAAFINTAKLKTINLPSSLTAIGTLAFMGSGITSVTLPKNLKSLGYMVFFGTRIKSLVIKSKLSAIPGYAFIFCADLTSVTLPKGLKSIGEAAFALCGKLKTVTIPYTVVTFKDYIFEECSPDLVIRGYKNSRAQSYAKAEDIGFKSIGATPKINIKAAPNKIAYGSVSGAGKLYYGKTCKLTAKAKAGYKFVKWMEGKKTVSRNAAYSFPATKARALKVVFAKK